MNAQQLRNSILQQAIQGRLVPQDPNDEPASVLLKRIRKEKERLVKEGKLKKKDLESKPIEEDEIPFEIPESWEWCKLNDCLDVRDGTHDTPKYVTSGYPLVTSKNLRNGTIDFKGALFISKEDHEAISCRSKVDENDILYAMIGTVGNPVLVRHKDFDFSIKNMALFKHVGDYVFMDYVYWYLYFAQVDMKAYASGGVQTFVSLGYLRNYLIPLPPLAEQCRIVAKIEELMPLVERYGKAQQALDQLNESLPARLRQSILQEAIQGRLVPQDPKEEPASELLKRILTTVNKSSTKKKILTKIKEEDMPENLVDGWEYFYIKDVFFTTSGGTPIKGHPDYYGGDIPWVKSGELNNKYLHDSEQKITELGLKNSSAKFFPIDTVAIAMYGATIGKTSIFKKEMTTNQAICGIFPVEGILPEYIYYFLIAKKQDFCSQAFGGAQPNISQEKIKNTVFPLPPLSEQKRIVAKVEELFGVMR
jgi:type I restriction enzyme S subunit